MNAESSKLRDQDLVKWIENKLGDPNELWAGRQASTLLTQEMIVELETCFQALEPHVKLKIIQSISHLSPRLVQLWRQPLTNLIELARRDADDWVETVADMYRDFPEQKCIRCEPSNKDSYFNKTLEELHRIVKQRIDVPTVSRVLPPDFAILSHSAIKARYGYAEIEEKKHFTRKTNTKSEQLLADVKKAFDHQNNPLNKKNNHPISSFPIKMRSTARKPMDLPMKGIPTRQLAKRDGGAKLIDFAELPNPMAKRRRNANDNNNQSQASKTKPKEPKTANSAKKVDTKRNKKNDPIPTPRTQPFVLDSDESNDEQDKASNCIQPISFVRASNNTLADEKQSSNSTYITHQKDDYVDPANESMSYDTNSVGNLYGSPTNDASSLFDSLPGVNGGQFASHDYSRDAGFGAASTSVHFLNTQNDSNNEAAMKQFEDLLKTANKLTPVTENLIAAFLSGNKTNALQSKLGALVTLPLSENISMVNDGSGRMMAHMVETFFQMNYSTGEWKRLKKSRPLKPEELQKFATSPEQNEYSNEYAQHNPMISMNATTSSTNKSSDSNSAMAFPSYNYR
uniref:HDAg domain-containing protein n=1 Tax=Ditylenchus dipsaci TaxID=166011 RepID=A0A915D0G9_9BILA